MRRVESTSPGAPASPRSAGTCARPGTSSSTSAWCCCWSPSPSAGSTATRAPSLVVQGAGFANQRAAYDTFEPGRLFTPGPAGAVLLHPRPVPRDLPAERPGEGVRRPPQRARPPGRGPAHGRRRGEPPARPSTGSAGLPDRARLRPGVRGPRPDRRRRPAGARCRSCRSTARFASRGVVKVPDTTPVPDGIEEPARVPGRLPAHRGDLARRRGLLLLPGAAQPGRPAARLPRRPRAGLRPPAVRLQPSTPRAGAVADGRKNPDGTPLSLAEVGRLSTRTMSVGDVWELPGGGSIAFTGYEEWATFQMTRDPGKLLALVAAIGMVGGLLLSLRVRRRRLWVRPCRPRTRTLRRAPAHGRAYRGRRRGAGPQRRRRPHRRSGDA